MSVAKTVICFFLKTTLLVGKTFLIKMHMYLQVKTNNISVKANIVDTCTHITCTHKIDTANCPLYIQYPISIYNLDGSLHPKYVIFMFKKLCLMLRNIIYFHFSHLAMTEQNLRMNFGDFPLLLLRITSFKNEQWSSTCFRK